jgi:hypothetical protein
MDEKKKEDPMMTRLLLCGVCLIAFHTGVGFGQTVASATDSPVGSRPLSIDKPSKAPGDIPEIIRQSDDDRLTPQPKAISDPGAVLRPPTVDLGFMRSIRLDWDHLGTSQRTTSR